MSVRDADVAVIGAGFSGLAAARRLTAAGASVAVLEARERVGGRVDREVTGGAVLDLGGTWAGPTQLRVNEIAKELGVATIPQHSDLESIVDLSGRIRRYKGMIPRLGPLTLLDLGRLQFKVGRAARRVDSAAPWLARNAERLDAVSLEDWLRSKHFGAKARSLLAIAGRTVWGAEQRELSMLYVLHYISGAGGVEALLDTESGAQHERFDGGALEIAERMAAGLTGSIAFESPVSRIADDGAGVSVEAPGATVRAKRAIVALPPPLCAEIEIDPASPQQRVALHRQWRMGALTKCFAVYDEPFWRADGASGEAVSDVSPVGLTFDVSPTDGSCGVLVGFVGGDDARDHAKLNEAEGRDAVLGVFARLYGDRALKPEGWARRMWATERYSGGGPVAIAPPGAMLAGGPALREPHGRVYWAGTETAERWGGYIEGAVVAGEHAADDALAGL